MATRKQLERAVLDALAVVPEHWWSQADLLSLVASDAPAITPVLQHLKRASAIRYRGNRFRLRPVSKLKSDIAVVCGVIRLLKARPPLTTGEIARSLEVKPATVSRECHRLARKSYLREAGRDKMMLFFDPITMEVINTSNYDEIMGLHSRLQAILRNYPPEDSGLKKALTKFFSGLLASPRYAGRRGAIIRFQRRLLDAIGAGKSSRALLDLLGLRQFSRDVPKWALHPWLLRRMKGIRKVLARTLPVAFCLSYRVIIAAFSQGGGAHV